MSVSERLKPVNKFQTTFDNLMMPIAVTFLYQLIFIILNGIDNYRDEEELPDFYIEMTTSTGYTIMAVLLAFWIGITAIQEGGSVGDGLVGGVILGFIYGLFASATEEFFSKDLLRGDLSLKMVQYMIYWIGLFMLVAIIAAGIAEDWLYESKPKPVKIIKAPPKKKPVQKVIKKTTKKKTTRKPRPVEVVEEEVEYEE